jgi:hypothetical protein
MGGWGSIPWGGIGGAGAGGWGGAPPPVFVPPGPYWPTAATSFTVLKPPANFQVYCQGTTEPILFTVPNPKPPPMPLPDPYEHDDDAGQAGIASELCRMRPIPMGSTVCLYIPKVPWYVQPTRSFAYVWMPVWRVRNIIDYDREGKPYHVSKGVPGAPDAGAVRNVIPAGSGPFLISCPEQDVVAYVPDMHNVYEDQFAIKVAYPAVPVLPIGTDGGGNLELQSGILDPTSMAAIGGVPAFARAAMFQTIWQKAGGDELCLLCWKREYAARGDVTAPLIPWNFTNAIGDPREDFFFQELFFNNPDAGVFCFWGNAPK